MKKKSSLLDHYSITHFGIVLRTEFNETSRLPSNSEIALCEQWLSKFTKPQVRFNKSHSSYGLKHQVEKWADTYVSNGAFIFAAFSLKYPIKVLDDGPNAIFGIKLLTPEEKWKHIRPTGFSKWLFSKKKENGAIGDLANDAVSDEKWPRNAEKFIEFWGYLNGLSVHDAVVDSLNLAWEEYSGQKAPTPNANLLEKCELFYEDEVDVLNYQDTYENAPDGFTFIYVLFEEVGEHNTRKVRYVGQTVCPSQRIQQHIVAPGNIEKVTWVGGLLNEGKKPKMAIIDCVPLNDATHMERSYINSFIHLERGINQKHYEVLLNKSLY